MRTALLILLSLFLSQAALADIYKLVDENGRVTYSNAPLKGAKKLNLEPISTVAMPKPKQPVASPAGFPRVDSETQKKRDGTRREILEQELGAEQKLLEGAKKAQAEGEATRQGDERNYQKYLDRVQALKDNVTLHEKNIEALNKELAGVR
ncbi:MAG: DUF4124 domain-containing protein [Sulfuricella sp.]|nr:DUF4124 domain-containing protein [Sulfuricella sp.]